MIVREFLLKKQVLIRGLAHPMLFSGEAPDIPFLPQEIDGVKLFSPENFARFGAVEVSPASIFELMKRNETILLFPGGAAELAHGKGEAYQLKWSKQTDFIRMAAAFGALIVPFGAFNTKTTTATRLT
jgi:hypothetical protein